VKSGKMRAILVLQPYRNPNLPDVPSTADVGYSQLDAGGWFGLLLPAQAQNSVG